jgi:lipopolysaccharide transport system ATP-binding protein
MKKLAIKAERISKQYRLGQIGTGTLSHDLNRFWHKLRGKPDPYLKIGEQNDRSKKGESEYVWSLKDINFEIEQGDAVGIIGRNGAGKSTLLKILSKVTQPTTGSIKVNGRIASLLEVGTGFHPEMTGRENIYMNGAILGMRKKEIDRKLDEIIDFSGVERYIDTPVKRYSSGMYVRLAFAVAAHLESEILIVDEVLAVGDAEFQKKCLGKMGEVSKGEGRTVLFVSHNMAAISKLCKNAIFIEKGNLLMFDKTINVINEYNKSKNIVSKIYEDKTIISDNKKVKIRKFYFTNSHNQIVNEVFNTDPYFHFNIQIEIFKNIKGIDISILFSHDNYGDIFTTCLKDQDLTHYSDLNYIPQIIEYKIQIPLEYLRGGSYSINLSSTIPNIEVLDNIPYAGTINIVDIKSPVSESGEGRLGAILPIFKWFEVK